jgi:hypothetical protein
MAIMANRTFDLLFLQDVQIAQICLKHYSNGGNKGYEDTIFVTQECASIVELEYWANSLKAELDRVVTAAKKKFAEPRSCTWKP